MELLEGRQLMAGDLGVINGTVYTDLTDNGIDASDPRLSGIQMTLFRDGGNGNFDNGGADDTQVGVQTTNPQGFYSFSGLTAGTYFVRQSAASGLIQRPSQTVQQVIITPAQADGSIGVLLDSFNEGQQIATAKVGGPTPVSNFLAVAGIAGGERDIFADATGGITGDKVEILFLGCGNDRRAFGGLGWRRWQRGRHRLDHRPWRNRSDGQRRYRLSHEDRHRHRLQCHPSRLQRTQQLVDRDSGDAGHSRRTGHWIPLHSIF
jgi:hypothetical protein